MTNNKKYKDYEVRRFKYKEEMEALSSHCATAA